MNVGLKQAGQVVFVLDISCEDVNTAKDEWARITGHLDPCWDAKEKTYISYARSSTPSRAPTSVVLPSLFT